MRNITVIVPLQKRYSVITKGIADSRQGHARRRIRTAPRANIQVRPSDSTTPQNREDPQHACSENLENGLPEKQKSHLDGQQPSDHEPIFDGQKTRCSFENPG